MIRVSHLIKKYGRTTAVDDISFKVQQGEIVGYLGPNSAGKSTTLKMLVGLLQPTSGEISVAGYDAATQLLELKRRIGYVPEEAQLYEHLTLVEHLQLIGRLYHVEEALIVQKITDIVFVGALFLAYLLNISVYFGVYCLMVIGGFIRFIYYFGRK